mmetsp:Transcript_5270/g.9437  ORF Transcript_5270/g.9437 Transcript_5270/m.9437 type:complete len:454 (+) Transcript_5270:214-1575(+)
MTMRARSTLLATWFFLFALLFASHSLCARRYGVHDSEKMGHVDAQWEQSSQGRELLAASLVADMAAPLLMPVVDFALEPVRIIVLEWIFQPITYQIKKAYDSGAANDNQSFDHNDDLAQKRNTYEVKTVYDHTDGKEYQTTSGSMDSPQERDQNGKNDFWGTIGDSIQSIPMVLGQWFPIDGSKSDPAAGKDSSATYELSAQQVDKSNEAVWLSLHSSSMKTKIIENSTEIDINAGRDLVDSRPHGLKRVTLDRLEVREKSSILGSGESSSLPKAQSKRVDEEVEVPSKFSVLKCGKVRAEPGREELNSHLVAGSEASLLMKLEGFSPSSAVILFGSQELAGDFGIPVPVVTNKLIRETLESLDDSRPGKVEGTECSSMQLGIGGLISTVEMGLDTPHKILRIINHTDRKGTTFVQRMKFTERYCTGKLYFQALDTKACKLTRVVNATLPDVI